MLYGEKSKLELNEYLEKLIAKSDIINTRRLRQEFYDNLENKFHMETSLADEIVTFKKDMAEFSPFELFCVLWFLDRKSLGKFFTQTEIESFSNEQFEQNIAEFPVVFSDMVQIADDQWIGRIDAQELMALKRARFINYDENEQRALRRVKRGDVEIFKPFVNQKSVSEIKAAMESGSYIPDPITLNMGEEADYTFANNTLTINSLPRNMFNLDDGYHRYLAISRICDFDKEFNYPMELRVVAFSNAKANSFIFQQDQKTKMKKIVSQTYDVNAIPNKICIRLNSEPTSNLQGMIGRNNAKIDQSVLSILISSLFIKHKLKKEEENSVMLKVRKELESKFNALTEQDDRFLGKYSDEMLFVTMYVFSTNIPASNYASTINGVLDGLTDEDKKLLHISSAGTVRRKAINLLGELLHTIKVCGFC